MKNYLKYSILITLTLMITIGSANALIGPGIGSFTQTNPYETLPATRTVSPSTTWVVVSAGVSMNDADEATSGTVYISSSATTPPATAYLLFSGFTAPSVDPTWISIQIKWQVLTAFVNSNYAWQYSIDGVTYVDLVAATTGKFDSDGVAQMNSFSQLAKPGGGSWTAADIGNLRVRLLFTRTASTFDGSTKKVAIYAVWASAYNSPVPPVSSPTMSIQPAAVSPLSTVTPGSGNDYIFVEIYCNDVTALAGPQFRINYDPAVLTPTGEYWLYYPWTDVVIESGADYIGYAGTIPVSNPLGSTGLTGNFAFARVFFTVNEDPANPGSGTPAPPNFSWLRLTISIHGDPSGTVGMPHAVYHGYYGTPPANAYVAHWLPASPFPYNEPRSTNWVEEYPNLGHKWHLSSWTDNGPVVGKLDPSDQIDMTPTDPLGTVQYFHVEQIWETDTGIAGSPAVSMILTRKEGTPEFPLGIGLMLAIAPIIPIAYLWRTRRRVIKK